MAPKPYLYQDRTNGVTTERLATVVSTGAVNAGDIPALGDDGLFDPSLMPTGTGREMDLMPASEALAAGDLVNYWVDSGTVKARKADASTAKVADGFVLEAVTSGSTATVYRNGRNTAVTGLTLGTQYLSATTPGRTTATPPTGADVRQQRVGFATTATSLAFSRGGVVRLAA